MDSVRICFNCVRGYGVVLANLVDAMSNGDDDDVLIAVSLIRRRALENKKDDRTLRKQAKELNSPDNQVAR